MPLDIKYPPEIVKLQKFAENARLLKEAAEEIYHEAVKQLNEAHKRFNEERDSRK